MSKRMLEFAFEILKLEKHIKQSYAGKHIFGQLFRAGTSAGANFEESVGAFSKSDFIYKTQIVLKEVREANFWIKLICRGNLINNIEIISSLINECDELVRIFSSSLVKSKGITSKKQDI